MQPLNPNTYKRDCPEARRYLIELRFPSSCFCWKMSCNIWMGALFVLALVFVSSASAGMNFETCVASFSDFEKAAITDNANNVQALVRAFYQVNNAFPLSVEVVYHVNSSNGTGSIISVNSDCPSINEVWLWVPSPVFIFIEPTKLNMYALYTLNYFANWSPPQVDLYIPNICNKNLNQFNFLNELTMKVRYTIVIRHV